MLIDIHTSLNSDAYNSDYRRVIQEALDEDIRVIIVGRDLDSSKRAIEIADEFGAGVYATVGMHPRYIAKEHPMHQPLEKWDQYIDLDAFAALSTHDKVVAFGDVGLDYSGFPDQKTGPHVSSTDAAYDRKHLQKDILQAFIRLSEQTRLPLLLHCRNAHQELTTILKEFDTASTGFDTRGVVHDFSGTWADAVQYLNWDFLLSFSGKITATHFDTVVIKQLPRDKILAETNSPYSTPTPPGAGRRNEPKYLRSIVREIAAQGQLDPDALEEQIWQNTLRAFPKITP